MVAGKLNHIDDDHRIDAFLLTAAIQRPHTDFYIVATGQPLLFKRWPPITDGIVPIDPQQGGSTGEIRGSLEKLGDNCFFVQGKVDASLRISSYCGGTLREKIASVDENTEAIHFPSLENIKGPLRDPSYVAHRPV